MCKKQGKKDDFCVVVLTKKLKDMAYSLQLYIFKLLVTTNYHALQQVSEHLHGDILHMN